MNCFVKLVCVLLLWNLLLFEECRSLKKLKKLISSALVGDFLSTLPSRFPCVGVGRNFTRFSLYSRMHPDLPRPLVAGDRDLLARSDFDPGQPTKVIVHGFVDNLHISDWMQRMKTRFLSVGSFNVLFVDWSCGNDFPYFQAVQNSRATAGELAKLIHFLQDATGADPGQFHLIGHSLGCHIAALVGHAVPGLGRISALDPAGPRFYDAPLEDRLDPGDAQFVDAIHTDAGHGLMEGLGLRSQVGHVDFYPNGGKDQPGCHSSPFTILPRIGIHRAARYYITCDHFRSVEYYIDSIRPPLDGGLGGGACHHVGVACRDWETFSQGRCAQCTHPDDCASMGYYSFRGPQPASKHEFYVKTAEEEPFCMYQYQVVLETGCGHEICTEDDGPAMSPGVLRMEVSARGGRLNRLNMDEDVDRELKPGAQYVYLATSRYPVGEVRGAKVWWGHPAKPEVGASHRTPKEVNSPSLKRIQVIPIGFPEQIAQLSTSEATVLCGSSEKAIETNQYLELTVNDC